MTSQNWAKARDNKTCTEIKIDFIPRTSSRSYSKIEETVHILYIEIMTDTLLDQTIWIILDLNPCTETLEGMIHPEGINIHRTIVLEAYISKNNHCNNRYDKDRSQTYAMCTFSVWNHDRKEYTPFEQKDLPKMFKSWISEFKCILYDNPNYVIIVRFFFGGHFCIP